MENFISKWQNPTAVALIILIIVYGSYNYVYKPKIKEIQSLKTSLKLIDSEIKMIPGGDLILKDMDGAKSLLKKELDVLATKIPSENQTPYLINNFISVVGRGLNIDYNLIQPSELVQEQKYKRLPLRVEFEGDYANLNTYLAQLKKLPVTIRVDNMELHKIQSTQKLAVKIQLSAFVMPGGEEKASVPAKASSYLYDPFYSEREKKEELKLEGLKGLTYSGYWIGKQMKAIINDEVLSAGDTIQGFKILKIYKDRVILIKSGKLFELLIRGNT